MQRMKQFAEKLKQEIRGEIKKARQEGKVPRKLSDMEKLESEIVNGKFYQMLDEAMLNDAEITEKTLLPFFNLLQDRGLIFNLSNGNYCNDEHSPINIGFIALAKRLFEELNKLRIESGREKECFYHYYDCLFPGRISKKYISSLGFICQLPLSGFILSEDGIPIEILECLDRFHNDGKDSVFPYHVCLTKDDLLAREKQKKLKTLSRDEIKLLLSHSEEARLYYQAIVNKDKETPESIAECRNKLIVKMAKSDFVHGCTYGAKSNKNLIASGFLTSLVDPVKLVNNRLNLSGLAHILSTKLKVEEWDGFVKDIDDENFDLIVLPLKNDNKPDVTMVNPDKFEAFVENDNWYLKEKKPVLQNAATAIVFPSLHNNAVIYLLAELYGRKRPNEPDRFGVVNQYTGLGCSMADKIPAVKAIKDWTKTEYFPLRWDDFLVVSGNTMHKDAFGERLGFLINKAKRLAVVGAEIMTTAATELCNNDPSTWKELLEKLMTNELVTYIRTCGNLITCVQMAGHYRKDNPLYNKAVLSLFTQFYLITRPSKNDRTDALQMGYDKVTKIEAAKELLKFFASPFKLNELNQYLAREGKQELEAVMRNLTRLSYFYHPETSELDALVSQAELVCKPDFFDKKQEQASSWMPSLSFRRGK